MQHVTFFSLSLSIYKIKIFNEKFNSPLGDLQSKRFNTVIVATKSLVCITLFYSVSSYVSGWIKNLSLIRYEERKIRFIIDVLMAR